MRFVAAPEYPVFPTREQPLRPTRRSSLATAETRAGDRASRARRGRARHPDAGPRAGAPSSRGSRRRRWSPTCTPWPARAAALRVRRPPAAHARGRVTVAGVRSAGRGRVAARSRASSTTRGRGSACRRCDRLHGGLSEQLCLVGTFPQLEYPRDWPEHVHVVGPLMWEPPFAPVQPPPGDAPLVLVAPVNGPGPRPPPAARGARAGWAASPSGCWRPEPPAAAGPVALAANARLVEWVSYAQTMPGCALVICHAGHGTLARALACGCPVLAVPHAGDMAENAARLDWAGAGVRLPWPLLSPLTLRLAARRALGRPGAGASGAAVLAAWARPAAWRRAGPRTWSRSWRSGVARCAAHERDELGVLALHHVDRLAVARAQLDHDPLVGQLQRMPDRAALLPALQLIDRRRALPPRPAA